MDTFRSSATVRFWTRTLAIAVLTYLVSALKDGDIGDLDSFITGLSTAVAYALLGLLTPLEPFVGVKASNVQVPVPPATRET